MREVSYKTHWSYLGPAVKQKAPLSEFVLDILYLMEHNGVVPPFHILNEVLQGGGNNGGMGPGTSWRPFKLKKTEYDELVQSLLNIDVEAAKKSHPYVQFQKVIVDSSLDGNSSYIEWVKAVSQKYHSQ